MMYCVMSCRVMPCDIMICDVVSCDAVSCLVMSCRVGANDTLHVLRKEMYHSYWH